MKDLEALFPKPGVTVTREIHAKPMSEKALMWTIPIQVSRHANKRLKERTSLSKQAVRRILDEWGVIRTPYHWCLGDLRDWVRTKLDTRQKRSESGILNGNLWIISYRELITIIPLPPEMEWKFRRFDDCNSPSPQASNSPSKDASP